MKTVIILIALSVLVSCTDKKEIAALRSEYRYTVYDPVLNARYFTNEILYRGGSAEFVSHDGDTVTCSSYTLVVNGR